MIKYLTDVIVPVVQLQHSILIVDAFEAHYCPSVREFLSQVPYIQMFVIPGGITCIAQPCEVCINAPFKAIIRKMSVNFTNEKIAKHAAKLQQRNDERPRENHEMIESSFLILFRIKK